MDGIPVEFGPDSALQSLSALPRHIGFRSAGEIPFEEYGDVWFGVGVGFLPYVELTPVMSSSSGNSNECAGIEIDRGCDLKYE